MKKKAVLIMTAGFVLFILYRMAAVDFYFKLAIARTNQFLDKVKKRIRSNKKTDNSPGQQRIREGIKWLDSMQMEQVRITTRDGLKLAGHYLENPRAKRVVIMFHGWRGSWGGDGGVMAKSLYEEGCSLLLTEQRAHDGSEGKYIGFGILERKDCKAWASYIEKRTLKKLPIYLEGVSMGAATVLMAAGENLPESVKGIIADCGFTTPYEMVKIFATKMLHVREEPNVGYVNFLCKRKAGYDLKGYSTIEAMQKCKIPVFFAHGTGDDFVPYSMSVENYKACAAPSRMLTVDGAEHCMCFPMEPEKYMKALKEFFHWE